MITLDIGLLGALFALLGLIGGYVLWYARMRERFLALERHDKRDHDMLKLLAKAQLAALDGLIQQGCNGEVTKIHAELKQWLIEH